MSQPITIKIRYSYFYPDSSYFLNLYNASNPVVYGNYSDFELVEQITNTLTTFGDLQQFITQVTGIPPEQQHLVLEDETTKLTGKQDDSLERLGLKDQDVLTLKTNRFTPFDYSQLSEKEKEDFVKQFPAPANLNDLTQLDDKVKWAMWESNTADQNIYTGAGPLQSTQTGQNIYSTYPVATQYFNPANPQTPIGDVSVTKIIAWNALPGLLRNLSPYTEVYKQADLTIDQGERTNQTEYCEWMTFYADDQNKKISKIVFTCEGPEYWQQLFSIDPKKCVALYRQLTGIPSITENDLIAQEDIYLANSTTPIVEKGQYNFYNDYNTKYGIVHLNQRNNYLSAELNIASMSTQLQQVADAQGNLTVLQKALPLVFAGQYGSPGRNSDPTIGYICNWVARHPLGLRLTIKAPVALYLGKLNTTGWEVPAGSGSIEDWVKCVRGDAATGHGLRYEIAPPTTINGKDVTGKYSVNDLTIGGQSVEYAGQIARCITVQLTGIAAAFPADTPSIAPAVRQRTVMASSMGIVDPISQKPWPSNVPKDTKSTTPAQLAKRTPHDIAETNHLKNPNPPRYSLDQALQKMAEEERETILDIDDIQGDPLIGFNTSNSIILFVDIDDLKSCKKWLKKSVLPLITNTRTVKERHQHMREYRKNQETGTGNKAFAKAPRYSYLNISFSNEGLARLTSLSDVAEFYQPGNSEAYFLGMPKRSTLLGDPAPTSKSPGSLQTWKVGGDRTPDIMIQIQCDTMSDCEKMEKMLLETGKSAVTFVFHDIGKRRDGKTEKPKEQFGFHDGISNPEFRGMYTTDKNPKGRKLEYISKRHIDPTDPRWNLFGKPGSSLIWPGELILGYKKQRNVTNKKMPQEYLLPDDDSFIGPDWAKNGTFVIYRRLNQNVASFWNHARETADAFNEQLKQQNAPADWTPEKVASRFVGRWPSGCPIMLSPDKDVLQWGESKMTQNAFMYAVDTPPFPSKETGETTEGVKSIVADNVGMKCPFGAHVRKVNPRDHPTDSGPDEDTLKHRLVRRGTPFGPFVPETDKFKDDGKERGLQFIAYAANIDMQFEFLLRFWANFDQQPAAMTSGFAHDMVIGQPAQDSYERKFTVAEANKDGVPVVAHNTPTKDRWVFASGGGYFFLPSISTIREKLCQ